MTGTAIISADHHRTEDQGRPDAQPSHATQLLLRKGDRYEYSQGVKLAEGSLFHALKPCLQLHDGCIGDWDPSVLLPDSLTRCWRELSGSCIG